ncbi:tetratricopeptide repeat protein [Lysobacter korlensis]|uniref:Tetratricopeptide repeat protein n=1 Tax=Lysobacter korlensis TaxID=553636 RepID=A0ABV6RQ44_9GAMM
MTRWSIALLLLLFPLCGLAQRPPAVVPTDRAAVVETLPKGYAALMPRGGQPPSAAAAQELLETAARSGDARLVARADAMLARIPEARRTPASLRAQAYAAQYRHDFASALALLDRAIELDSRDADARLSRAQIRLVQGDLKGARRDCTSLAIGIDSDAGLLCVAALGLRRGDYAGAAKLLDHWFSRAPADADTRRHALVMRAEVASRSGGAEADAWFRRALALDPRDVRTLAAMSRHLRSTGRPAEAYALLADAPVSDHLLLERALAAHASDKPDAARLASALERRFALTRRLGAEPDLRDEAEYLLVVRNDAAAALPLAQHNFAEQRDHEDVDLLRRAAHAAGQPQALRTVEAWAGEQGLELSPLQVASR